MATKTDKYELRKKEDNDFYNIDDFNDNMDKIETALTEFDDSGSADGITSFTDMLTKLVTGNKLAVTLRNLKAGLQFVLHAGSIVNNCVTDNAKLPLSAAQGKALQDAITKLNSEAFFVPVSYFRDKINKTYSRIEVFIFGKLVVIRVNVLVDDFDKYYGEATDDLRNIPALAHLSDTLEVRTPGSVRTNDNVTTLKQYGTILISGGKIFANMPEKTISSGYISGQIITYLLQ